MAAPTSLEELNARISSPPPIDPTKSLDRYFTSSLVLLQQADSYRLSQSYEQEYLTLYRFTVVYLEWLKDHPSWNLSTYSAQRSEFRQHCAKSLDRLTELKSVLLRLYADRKRATAEKEVAALRAAQRLKHEQEARIAASAVYQSPIYPAGTASPNLLSPSVHAVPEPTTPSLAPAPDPSTGTGSFRSSLLTNSLAPSLPLLSPLATNTSNLTLADYVHNPSTTPQSQPPSLPSPSGSSQAPPLDSLQPQLTPPFSLSRFGPTAPPAPSDSTFPPTPAPFAPPRQEQKGGGNSSRPAQSQLPREPPRGSQMEPVQPSALQEPLAHSRLPHSSNLISGVTVQTTHHSPIFMQTPRAPSRSASPPLPSLPPRPPSSSPIPFPAVSSHLSSGTKSAPRTSLPPVKAPTPSPPTTNNFGPSLSPKPTPKRTQRSLRRGGFALLEEDSLPVPLPLKSTASTRPSSALDPLLNPPLRLNAHFPSAKSTPVSSATPPLSLSQQSASASTAPVSHLTLRERGDGASNTPSLTYQERLRVLANATGNFPLKGLKNLGNTCWMNSLAQCLSNTPPLVNFFLLNQYKTELVSHGTFAEAFSEFLIDFWRSSPHVGFIAPSSFLSKFRALVPSLSTHNRQQDAHEGLTYTLDLLHDSLNRSKSKTYREEGEASSSGALKGRLRRDDSHLWDLFGGQFQSSLECPQCSYTSRSFDHYTSISLELEDKENMTLVAAFTKFTKVERVEWKCERCTHTSVPKRKFRLSILPRILIIHLKRFRQTPAGNTKISTFVHYPVRNLSLLDFTTYKSRNSVREYDLYGVVCQNGSLSSGHYTAYVKRGGKWLYCNDSVVSVASENDVVNENAYLLFYYRKDMHEHFANW